MKPYVPPTQVGYSYHRNGHVQKRCRYPTLFSNVVDRMKETNAPMKRRIATFGRRLTTTQRVMKINRRPIRRKRKHQLSQRPSCRHITGCKAATFPRRPDKISTAMYFPHLSPTPDISTMTASFISRENSGLPAAGNKRNQSPKETNKAPSSKHPKDLPSKITALKSEQSSLQRTYKYASAAQVTKEAQR